MDSRAPIEKDDVPLTGARVARDRIGFVDDLRAIAVFIVVFSHLGLSNSGSFAPIAELIRKYVLLNGHLGVTLFFIVSGFVIPSSLLSHRTHSLAKFFVSRLSRLYPAYWLSIGLALLVLHPDIDPSSIAANVTMMQRFLRVDDVQGVYWTLSVEMIFYCLTAFLFFVGLMRSDRPVGILFAGMTALTLVSAVLRTWLSVPLPAGTMMFLCLMFLGAWLRSEWKDGFPFKELSVFLIVMLACSWLLYYPAAFGTYWLLEYSKFLFATLIFVAVAHWNPIGLWPLRYIGRISYSIYLFHYPIVVFVRESMSASSYGIGVFVLSSLIAILAFSSLTFHVVEQPFIHWGRMVNARWSR